jgi:glycosyltransferase involved in cell wall biosynthesis
MIQVLVSNLKFLMVINLNKNTTESFTVGLVARFRPQKRVDRWVEVAHEVQKLNPTIKFLMVGDGPDDAMLREKIKELGMEGKIELPGMLPDTVAAFKQMHIFLLTSDFEGLPLALMEAMSTGCVPVVSDVGGIKQVCFEGFGYKFNKFETKQIASVIAGYASDPKQFKQESMKARAFVEKNYSLAKQVEEIINLYKEMM